MGACLPLLLESAPRLIATRRKRQRFTSFVFMPNSCLWDTVSCCPKQRNQNKKSCELDDFTFGTFWTVAFQHHPTPIDFVTTTLPLSSSRHPYAGDCGFAG